MSANPQLGISIRLAQTADIPAMEALIHLSGEKLSQGYYTPEQIAAVNHYVFGVDSSLVEDQTYFVVTKENVLVACGGWSRRRALYGGDQRRIGTVEYLNPKTDAAKIRAFFVHPDYARQGIGDALLTACEQAAQAAGFRALELMATLPGVPFYQARGFSKLVDVSDAMPNGVEIPFVKMTKSLA